MPSTGQSIAAMMASSARGYFGLTCHSRGWAAPYQTSADRARGREHERQAGGLADAHDGEPREIGGRLLRDGVDHGRERADRVRIADVAAGVAAMQRRLVGMAEVKVGRDRDVAVGREALGELANMPGQAVALVDDDDGGRLRGALGKREECWHLAAQDFSRADAVREIASAAHLATSARKLGSMKPASAGGVANSPMATRASRLACRPSGNSAASGAITCWRT